MKILRLSIIIWTVIWSLGASADKTDVIEKQLKDIGSISNEEVAVVQAKFTRKNMRHELSPFAIGGIPFGTFRRTLVGGASYTLHFADWIAWEAVNVLYTRNFFSSFTDDVNKGQTLDIKPDIEKLNLLATTGIQITPFYGKVSTFSRDIGYIEPIISLGAGFAKTESSTYFTFYPGIGVRMFFREWISLRIDFRDYIYTENFINRSTGAADSATRNNYAVLLSLSFWLPKMPR